MITTNKGFKKLEGGDYVPNAFYAEDSAFNSNVDLLERKLDAHKFGENLLLNWDFRRPVNQRGISGAWGVGYGLDMWMSTAENGAVFNGNSVTLTENQIQQSLEQTAAAYLHNGEVHTASVMFEDGSVHSGQLTPSASGGVSVNINGVIAKLDNGGGSAGWKWFCLKAASGTQTIKAVKLELGDVSTLAMDRCMDYGTELLKCQRYFVRYGGAAGATIHVGWGMAATTTGANCTIMLPTNMRIPLASLSMAGSVALRHGAADTAVTTISINRHSGNALYFVATTAGGLTAGEVYAIRLASGASIDISAEM